MVPNNPRTAWHVRPTSSTLTFIPEWVCADNPKHVWTATLASRSAGAGCPECKLAGKSKVELAHHEAATEIFGHAKSGQILRDSAFTGRPSWSVDISTTLHDGTLLAIEYDGSYWHADKSDVDEAKSRDLLAAGHRVVRLREHPLPPLIAALAHSRPRPGQGPEQTLRGSLRRLAQGHQQLASDIDTIDTRLGELAAQINPALLQASGVGPFVAAQLLVACGDNPDMLAGERQ